MNVGGLIRQSLKYRLVLNVLFFVVYRRRLAKFAASVNRQTEQPTKRSPFVYNMR